MQITVVYILTGGNVSMPDGIVPLVVTKPIDEVLHGIETLDLEPIRFKLVNGYGWTPEQADLVILEYRRFLVLKAKYSDVVIVPSLEVDQVWHAHILDTQKYAADCERVFGVFAHHFPYFGMRGSEDADEQQRCFVKTQTMYVREFGVDWPGQRVEIAFDPTPQPPMLFDDFDGCG